jgi:integrase
MIRRSSMSRRAFAPAVNGNRRTKQPAVIAGMHFHELGHTHRTWLIGDERRVA